MIWNDENKQHALEQLKYLLQDWINTNKPNLNLNEDIFNKTCSCILETVIIPKYEYKDGIEYIEWTTIDQEMINSCIDKFINIKESKIVDNDTSKVDTQNNFMLYTFIGIFIFILILLFLIYYFKFFDTSNVDNNIFNLEYD